MMWHMFWDYLSRHCLTSLCFATFGVFSCMHEVHMCFVCLIWVLMWTPAIHDTCRHSWREHVSWLFLDKFLNLVVLMFHKCEITLIGTHCELGWFSSLHTQNRFHWFLYVANIRHFNVDFAIYEDNAQFCGRAAIICNIMNLDLTYIWSEFAYTHSIFDFQSICDVNTYKVLRRHCMISLMN